MGLEFMPIFKEWAHAYDDEVNGRNQEYQEVFENYWLILAEIVKASGTHILEFGSGTGNLTEELLAAGKFVYPVEPSLEMRRVAKKKPALKNTKFVAGDMEDFPLPAKRIDTIVSNLVFHHLDATEKKRVIAKYNRLLPLNGNIVFGDTMFLSKASFDTIVTAEKAKGNQNLVADLQREYYPLIPELETIFQENGFQTNYQQMNRFVWLVKAVKVNEVQ